ncbi:MAG TPA: aminotransferase class III-fold pyridoxal phosphate-dependent enzyme [Gemmataceae bacterium]|nr:aminotransferase class III-fold pyridoxal phosphate-dependent enzyme [Gemmataceae bacterium]
MDGRHPLIDTLSQLIHEQTPNLLRLYISPYVTQTCLCLSRYVQTAWQNQPEEEQATFLANSFDEALSGAIKLVRYANSVDRRATSVLVFDPSGRLGPFVSAKANGHDVAFLPGIEVAGHDASNIVSVGAIVLVAGPELDRHADAIRAIVRLDTPRLIVCFDRASLGSWRREPNGWWRELSPDVVIFDESFVDHHVPFGAFTGRKTLFDHWNRPGKTTFHSTTFQPNSIASLHFIRSLAKADPEFHAVNAGELAKFQADRSACGDWYARLYSSSLRKTARSAGFADAGVRASGAFVHINGRQIFDAVGGVACSVRGHNPPGYVGELAGLHNAEVELATRLRELTGMPGMVPAVSGASAVESALKLALVAQFPRRHVIALRSGFGGKTLLALTGTANPAYKDRIEPLYADVHYVDPFAADAVAQLETALKQNPVAVVQVELIQGVGGVRQIPDSVIRFLDAHRQQFGYLLLVDEVQTGMCRTGPFTRSGALGITPDLLLLGKATSDMMFPCALMLFSQAVRDKLAAASSDLPEVLRRRHGYEFGYKTMLNVLRHFETHRVSEHVSAAGKMISDLLGAGLAMCPYVREVRVFGLLFAIELDDSRWPLRWFRKKLNAIYLYAMLRHPTFPVLAGFCQYEPNVLKITPPLDITPEQVRAMCATMVDVLSRPFPRLLAGAVGGMLSSFGLWRIFHEHGSAPAQADEPAVG